MLSVLQIRMSYCQNAQKVGIHIGYMISNRQKWDKNSVILKTFFLYIHNMVLQHRLYEMFSL